MSESQSRYSIVERLTKQELDIMTAKSDLVDDITKAGQEVSITEKSIEADKHAIDDEGKVRKADLDRQLERAKQKVDNLKARKIDKEKLYTAKIKAIDLALKNVADISKNSES